MLIRNDCNKEELPLKFEMNGKCYLPEELYIEVNNKYTDLLERTIKLEKKTENCIIKVPYKCYEIITIYSTSNRNYTTTKTICPDSNYNCDIKTPFGWEPLENGWFRRISRNSNYLYTRSFNKTITGGNPYLTEKEYLNLKGRPDYIRFRLGHNISIKDWLKLKNIK